MQVRLVKTSFILAFIFSFSFSAQKAWALRATITHNIFYAPENNNLQPYIEIYWDIDPNTLLYAKKDNLWTGKIQTDIVITKNGAIATEEHYILETKPEEDLNILYQQHIMDLRRYSLDTGDYGLKVTLTDLVKKGGEFEYAETFSIKKTNKPFFSDIQLIDTLIPSTEKNIYQRNNQIQIPLASNFLDEHRKSIKYYTELYQANLAPNATFGKVFISSKKETSNPIYNLADTFTVNHNLLDIISGSIDVAVLPSGNYYIHTELYDSTKHALASKSLFFQILNAHPVAYERPIDTAHKEEKEENQSTYINLNKTYLSKYTPEQIRLILKMLLPISDPTERLNINGFLKNPDDMYSRYFIYNFWSKRNKIEPEDTWKAYTEKVKYTNKEFGTSMLRGFESDRGRVFLQYGQPTERVRVENEEGANPYEIWQYDIVDGQSNVLFLFVRTGFAGSDYRLTHSTYTGEKVNKRWRTDLYLSGTAISTNSRAEQYFGNR